MATTSQNPSPSSPTKLGGFELHEQIGEGGMGTVYLAKQTSLDRTVALKILTSRLSSDAKYIDSFLREARSAARLNHSNIVHVYDAGKADDQYYYAMEFVSGETLQKWVSREGALPETTVLEIGVCITNALKHGWDKEQLIHRDIKPDNIIIDTDGNVKLLDLGLAKSFGENTLLTLSGQVFGTPQYMSPEQARAHKVDCRTDIYALGLTLYYALTGNIPFHGGTPAEVMARQLHEQLDDPRDTLPTVSAHTVRVLERMTSKDVENRYASWDDVLRDLHLARSGNPPQIPLLFKGNSSVKRRGLRVKSPEPEDGGQSSEGRRQEAEEAAPETDFEHEGNEENKDPSRTLRPSVKNSATQVSGFSPQPSSSSPHPSKKSRTPTFVVGGALLILALAAGGYFFFRSSIPPFSHSSDSAASRLAAIKQFAEQNPTRLLDLEDRLRGFLAEFPNSPQAKEANAMLSSVMIERGQISGISPAEMERQNKEAQRRYDEALAQAKANQLQQTQLASELQTLIAQFPNSPAAQQARQHLASLPTQQPPVVVVPPQQNPPSSPTEEAVAKLSRLLSRLNKPLVQTKGTHSTQSSSTPNQPDELWENSLGMKFVPVKGTDVLFSIWETRVQDFEAFVKATGRTWEKPNFEQGPTHPAVMVSWNDAKDFCKWLTEKERREGRLTANQEYRLPTDAEWSIAVGLGEEEGNTPEEKRGKIKDVYPWDEGRGKWPPPRGAGNYIKGSGLNTDDFPNTSPVGSFKPNQHGLFDMGGNAAEWCEDLYSSTRESRTVRGGYWRSSAASAMASSSRDARGSPSNYDNRTGFRCVLVVGKEQLPPTSSVAAPWENSLGIKFVSVKGTDVLFSIWETRVQDFEAFVKATGRTWQKPDFEQGPTHPAVMVSWNDAKDFCKWLTEKDRREGRLTANQEYRLPTDAEWSVAVGTSRYPWGEQWPPKESAGNFAGEEAGLNWKIRGYRDNYRKTAPVGSFPANTFGLYDMGGNVWEWCEPQNNRSVASGFRRGGSWYTGDSENLLSSKRLDDQSVTRNDNLGLRCVLVVGSASTVPPPTPTGEEAERAKVLQAFGEFQKSFLASLAKRDYAGAQQQAQQMSDNPLFESLKERAVAFGEVAARLDKFWSSLPATLAALKGKTVTAQGETGVVSGVTNGNLELEKTVTGGTAITELPISKLTPEDLATLLTQAKPNDDKTKITLALLYFAEGNPRESEFTLREAEKAGVDVKSARKVLEWLGRVPVVEVDPVTSSSQPLSTPAPKPRADVIPVYLGIQMEPASSSTKVSAVVVGSPAEKGGIRAGDHILEMNGLNMTTPREMMRYIGTLQPGDKVNIILQRNGVKMDITVSVAPR